MDQANPTILFPPITPENAPFWQGCEEGRLRLQRCSETQRLIFPPRPYSPWARDPRAQRPEWVDVEGVGTIWSYVVAHPPLLAWYAARAPYNVILVALDEDPNVRLTGNLIARPGGEINEIDPRTIEIGAGVRAVFETIGEIRLPRWVLA